MMPVYANYLKNITFVIDGEVWASQDYQNCNKTSPSRYQDFWFIEDSEEIHFTGSGVVDGQGYWWWMREIAVLNNGKRPRLLQLSRVRNASFEYVKW